MQRYQLLFKNRGRWLEFNVRVTARSIGLIFFFECVGAWPTTHHFNQHNFAQGPPAFVSLSFLAERNVGLIELGDNKEEVV